MWKRILKYLIGAVTIVTLVIGTQVVTAETGLIIKLPKPITNIASGIGQSFTLGMVGVAYATTPDYICDGVADDVEIQAAMNALPATGGELFFFGGNYVLTATVTRAINNINILGSGKSTYFSNDGGTAIFSAGAQTGWSFGMFRTDAGYVNVSTSLDTIISNVWNVNDVVGKTVRSATIVLAASDANDTLQSQADIVCDGTDDDNDINDAIALLPASGGVIELTQGTYTWGSGNVTIPAYVTVKGVGVTTEIVTPNTGDLFILNGTYATLSDMKISHPAGRTSDVTVIILAQNYSQTIHDVWFYQQYDCIEIGNGTTQPNINNLYNLRFYETVHNDIYNISGENTYIHDCIGHSQAGFSHIGFYWVDGDTVMMSNCSWVNYDYGMYIGPAAGNTLQFGWFENVTLDTLSTYGIMIYGGNVGSHIYNLTFTDLWISGVAIGGQRCANIEGTGVDGVYFNNAKFFNNLANGTLVSVSTGAINVEFDACKFAGTTVATGALYLDTSISYFSVTNCNFADQSGITQSPAYHIYMNGNGHDYYRIIGNDLHGATTDDIFDGGSGANIVLDHNID